MEKQPFLTEHQLREFSRVSRFRFSVQDEPDARIARYKSSRIFFRSHKDGIDRAERSNEMAPGFRAQQCLRAMENNREHPLFAALVDEIAQTRGDGCSERVEVARDNQP